MKKYKNLGSPWGVIVNGKTLDFQNGQIVDLPDDFIEDIKGRLEKFEDMTPKPTGISGTPITVITEIPMVTAVVKETGYKNCLVCGKSFKPLRKTQIYCSSDCQKRRKKL